MRRKKRGPKEKNSAQRVYLLLRLINSTCLSLQTLCSELSHEQLFELELSRDVGVAARQCPKALGFVLRGAESARGGAFDCERLVILVIVHKRKDIKIS